MDGVQMPLWMIFLTVIAGPTLVYFWEKVIKPWRDARVDSEGEHVRRAYGQADNATKQLFDFLSGQVTGLTGKVALVEGQHAQCQRDLAVTNVKLAQVEVANTSLVERVSTLTASNDKLRRIFVRLETKSPELFDNEIFND
jgi:phage-related minor tail protein